MILDFLQLAYQKGASDIHLSVGNSPMLRLHGQLVPIRETELTFEETLAMIKDLTNEQQFSDFQKKGEVDFAYEINGLARFRVNAFKQKGAYALACRLIQAKPPSIEQLQLPEIIRKFAHHHQGLLLVTGPTGSGKSTTLAAIIHYINAQMSKHIMTLEDPIEFIHAPCKSLINQREIGQDSTSFEAALRAALRQDPDVILVGEMRDLETIKIAITAAETGHLVLATLHTTNAPQTIDRIVDAFPAVQQQQIRTQLAGVLIGIVSQRLLPTLEGNKRVAAFELLVNTPGIANLIRSDKIHQIKGLMETGKQLGMQTMEHSVHSFVQNGLISRTTASEYAPGWEQLF